MGKTANVACPDCGVVQEQELKEVSCILTGGKELYAYGECSVCEAWMNESVQ